MGVAGALKGVVAREIGLFHKSISDIIIVIDR